ncbi:hypothetical protein CBM2586_A50027 [Cupriavidus phytorum]|uniref:Uncharacterized protein n=1 Tax=Cupriavidus taiwanensis TaxID=164546 RepID=A0A975X846_9BURK|nr:hypothetical protein CBM2586_A50027 [Cupriavidus taiwanensis]
MRISPRYWSDIWPPLSRLACARCSALRRIDAIRGDDVVQRQRRHLVAVRLGAAAHADGAGRKGVLAGRVGGAGVVERVGRRRGARQHVRSRRHRRGHGVGRLDRMGVPGDLARQQRYVGAAEGLADGACAQSRSCALAQRQVAAQVGQPEGGGAVAAVDSAQQREQHLVLGNAERLASAELPSRRCKVACKHADLTHERLRHDVSSTPARVDAGQRNDVVQHQRRLHVVVRLSAAGAAAGLVQPWRERVRRAVQQFAGAGHRRIVGVVEVAGRQHAVLRYADIQRRRRAGRDVERMAVGWHLRGGQRDRLGPRHLALCDAVGIAVQRRAAAQVGQGEIGGAVAAVLRAEQAEQRLVLRDGQQGAVAQRPALRRKRERAQPDFPQILFQDLPPRLNNTQKTRRLPANGVASILI